MQIGFDAKRLFKNFTGLGNYSRTLLENLQTQFPEHNYLLFTEKTNETKRTAPFFVTERYQIIQPTSPSKLWRMYGINKQIKSEQVDVFHGLSAELPVGISVPSVVTIHDLIFESNPKQYSFVNQKIYSTKAKYACTKANKIIAISEATKKDINKYYNIEQDKIDVVYQTCDEIFFKPISESDIIHVLTAHNLPEKYLLYVGSVIERKGLLTVIKAIQKLPLDKRLPLVAIGGRTSKYAKQVEKYILKNQLSDWVFLYDDIPFDDFPAIYKNAEIMIYPSQYEGFGIPVIEAQAVGTPVITSNVSSLPEAAGPHSYLLDEISPIKIMKAIEEILSNSERKKEMIEAGYIYIEKFDKKKNMKQLMDIYHSII